MNININTKIIRNPNVIAKAMKEEFIIVDPSRGNLYRLNPTAQLIWKVTNSQKSISELVIKVTDKFNVDEKKAQKEVINFIKQNINQLFFEIK